MRVKLKAEKAGQVSVGVRANVTHASPMPDLATPAALVVTSGCAALLHASLMIPLIEIFGYHWPLTACILAQAFFVAQHGVRVRVQACKRRERKGIVRMVLRACWIPAPMLT